MSIESLLTSAIMLVLFAAAGAAAPPNVIVINCDDLGCGDLGCGDLGCGDLGCGDLGCGDLGCYGADDIRTPELDRMAREGTRFTDFSVVSPLCTPSRAALMTGKYPGRVGLAAGVLRPDSTAGLAAHEVTLAELARAHREAAHVPGNPR